MEVGEEGPSPVGAEGHLCLAEGGQHRCCPCWAGEAAEHRSDGAWIRPVCQEVVEAALSVDGATRQNRMSCCRRDLPARPLPSAAFFPRRHLVRSWPPSMEAGAWVCLPWEEEVGEALHPWPRRKASRAELGFWRGLLRPVVWIVEKRRLLEPPLHSLVGAEAVLWTASPLPGQRAVCGRASLEARSSPRQRLASLGKRVGCSPSRVRGAGRGGHRRPLSCSRRRREGPPELGQRPVRCSNRRGSKEGVANPTLSRSSTSAGSRSSEGRYVRAGSALETCSGPWASPTRMHPSLG